MSTKDSYYLLPISVQNEFLFKKNISLWFDTKLENVSCIESDEFIFAKKEELIAKQEVLADIEKCMPNGLDVLLNLFPILEEEELIDQYYSLVIESKFEDKIPSNSIVIIRKTTLSELAFVINFAELRNGEVKLINFPVEDLSAKLPMKVQSFAVSGVLIAIGGTIAKAVISTVVSKLVGKVMDTALSKVLKPQVPSYFEEVYKQTRLIVREELAADKLKEINAELSELLSDLKSNYLEKKNSLDYQSEEGKKVLLGMLNDYEHTLNRHISGLKHEDRMLAGQGLFCAAVNLKLMVYLDLISLDPFAKRQPSTYISTAIHFLNDSIQHLESSMEQNIKNRESMVFPWENVVTDALEWLRFIHRGVDYQFKVAYFSDKFHDKDYEFWGDFGFTKRTARSKRDEALTNYRNSTLKDEIEKWETPFKDLIANWQKTIDGLEKLKESDGVNRKINELTILLENWNSDDFSMYNNKIVWVEWVDGVRALYEAEIDNNEITNKNCIHNHWGKSEVTLIKDKLYYKEDDGSLMSGTLKDGVIHQIIKVEDNWQGFNLTACGDLLVWQQAEYEYQFNQQILKGYNLYYGFLNTYNKLIKTRFYTGFGKQKMSGFNDTLIWGGEDKIYRIGKIEYKNRRTQLIFLSRLDSYYYFEPFQVFDENIMVAANRETSQLFLVPIKAV